MMGVYIIPISQKRKLRLNKVKDLSGGPATGVVAEHCSFCCGPSHHESSECRHVVLASPHLMSSNSPGSEKIIQVARAWAETSSVSFMPNPEPCTALGAE